MTQLEQYRWEDHVPRKGSLKFNIVVGALAIGLLTGMCADSGDGRLATVPILPEPAVKPQQNLERTLNAHWLMSTQRLAM